MNKKILIYTAALIILAAAVLFLVSRFKYMLSEVLTWLIIIGVAYGTGWIIGRYARSKHPEERR